MSTVIFVHGTGVRKNAYDTSFDLVASELGKLHGVSVKPCYWGHLGSDLHAGGASIPEYDSTRSLEDNDVATATDEEYSVALWGILYEDPLYELRALAMRQEASGEWVPGQLSAGNELASLGKTFEITPQLHRLLETGGIAQEFEKARLLVTGSKPYRDALDKASAALAEYRAAIARAFIAMAVALVEVEAKAAPLVEQEGDLATVARDAYLRDETERLLIEALGGAEYSIGEWVKGKLGGLVLRVGTWKAKRRRGAITDAAYPATGDILLYQARGQQIRNFIKQQIADAPSPRIILAHSLGGIACVDLLVAEPIDVQLLVTAGSQAPFLYEINALQSLPYGQALPAQFPKWLNIYDLRDFLSYKGAEVFKGRVSDVKVDNRQPFPASHGAYWSNPAVWKAIKAIKEELP